MAVSGAVKLEVIAEAQENIKAVLQQSNAAIRKTANELKGAEVQQGRMGRTIDLVKGKALALKASLVALGAAAAYAAAQQLVEFTKEGAAMADQVDAVSGRVSNLDDIIKETQDATTGIVDEAAIVKGVALFDAFGLEIAQLPELFAEASKTSLRTGESLDTLISSAVTGIARMSPPILDNLGLQVRLADATEAAAKKFNVEADALDETQKKAGMLSIVLKRLGEQNRDIRLNESRVASIQRMEVAWKNFTDGIAKGFADMFKTSGERLEEFEKKTREVTTDAGHHWSDLTKAIEEETKAQAQAIHEQQGDQLRAFSLQQFFMEKSIALEEHKADALARIRLAEAKANTAALSDSRVATLEETGFKIWNADRFAAIQKRHADEATRINKAEMARIQARFEARRDELLSMDALTEVTIEAEREELARLAGTTQAQLDLTAAKRAYNRVAKEGGDEERATAFEAVKNAQKALNKERERGRARRSTSRAVREERDNLEELLAQQIFENKLARASTDLARAKLIAEQKRKELAKEMAKIGEHVLAVEYESARLAGIELEFAAALKETKDAERTDEGNALRIAELTLQIAREKSEAAIIDLELQRQILEIKDSDLSLGEEGLAIELAKLEAEKERGELAQFNREQLAETLARGIGGSAAEAATLLQDMDATLDKLNRPKRYENVIAGLNEMSRAIPEASQKFAELGKSSLDSGQKVAAGVSAGLGMIGPSVAAFVEGTTEKALIMGAFEAAMAVAMSFVNPAEAASHYVAAGMFFAMAGVSAALPTTKLPEEEETAAGGGLVTPAAAAPEEQQAQRITVNLGPGMLLGLPQDLGRAISDQINSMAGTGMEATAF